jgi:hypothetical protein
MLQGLVEVCSVACWVFVVCPCVPVQGVLSAVADPAECRWGLGGAVVRVR